MIPNATRCLHAPRVKTSFTRRGGTCYQNHRTYSHQIVPKIARLEPGLIHIKDALSREEQMDFAKIILKAGEEPIHGFWRSGQQGIRTLNSTEYRGRMYRALDTFPESFKQIYEKNLKLAVEADETLKFIEASHLLLLNYKTLIETPKRGYIPWHQDNGDNDGNSNFPVVSVTLGDTCEFLLCHSKPKIGQNHPVDNPTNLAHRILFKSGDIFIFGGPRRFIWHAIYHITPNTSPDFLQKINLKGYRLSALFRSTPQLRGKEKDFATNPANEMAPNSQYFRINDMK